MDGTASKESHHVIEAHIPVRLNQIELAAGWLKEFILRIEKMNQATENLESTNARACRRIKVIHT